MKRYGLAGYSLCVGLWACSVIPATAEFRLAAGDVIEVSIAGAPELKHRATIELDGSLSMPLMGTLVVGGLTPSEARAKIQNAMARQAYKLRTADGRDRQVAIDANEVAATVVEYRPIYVGGDVTKPGEYPFRSQVTVRQAIASAGGYGVPQVMTTEGAFAEAVQLRSELAAVWSELAKEQVRLARLRAELEGKVSFDPSAIMQAPIAGKTIAEIVALENEMMKTREQDRNRERDYLLRAIQQAGEHVDVLSEQQKKEAEGTQADDEEFQRVTDLFKRGAVAITRVTDARRAALLSSTRALQTEAQLTQISRQRIEFQRQLEKSADERHMALVKDLQDTAARVAGLQAKLQLVTDKLRISGRDESGLTKASTVTVYRRVGAGVTSIVADADMILNPGDVVDVSLRVEPVKY